MALNRAVSFVISIRAGFRGHIAGRRTVTLIRGARTPPTFYRREKTSDPKERKSGSPA
jgi:hypothetical protein